jgi:uncharacterized protein (TIGR00725 family)
MACKLPPRDRALGVIGGQALSAEAAQMARHLGSAIVDAGYALLTGGRRGAGEAATLGATEYLLARRLATAACLFALVPFGEEPDFSGVSVVHAGKDRFERRMVLMNSVAAVFVVGGGRGTESEIMHAAVDYYMGYETTANVVPVAGTGGVADRILQRAHHYDDALLDDPRPLMDKAKRLVACAREVRFPVHDYWGVDIHKGWHNGDPHPVVRETYRIRRYDYSSIPVEGQGTG